MVDLIPGSTVLIDQYASKVPGCLPHTQGKHKKEDKYNGGTIFIDHASQFVFVRHQVSLNAGETLKSKQIFKYMSSHRVRYMVSIAQNRSQAR